MGRARLCLAALLLFSIVIGPVLLACRDEPPTPTPTIPTPVPPTPTVTVGPPTLEPTVPVPPVDPAVEPSSYPSMASPDYGVHAFLWGNPHTERDLDLVQGAEFRWVKQMFEWRYIEPHEKGKFEWDEPDRVVQAVEDAGLKLIARVDNQPVWARSDDLFPGIGPPDDMRDFGDFISALATRYRGRIAAYQIWNEPNLAIEWGHDAPNAAQYVEMLEIAYNAIKAADPDAIVISAGLAPTTASGAIAVPDVEYLTQMYAAGFQDSVDLVGVHAAGYKAPPEVSPDDIAEDPRYNHGEPGVGRVYGFRHVEDLRGVMVEHGDEDRRVAVLEMGWSSDNRPDSPYAWHGVTEEQKADYLVRAFQYARRNWTPWIAVMTVIYISAPHWTEDYEQYYWAITNPDGSVRPAYRALAEMPK